jgi:hypothetical protein
MRTLIAILILTLSVTVQAKEKSKAKAAPKAPETKEDKPYREPVPGGARADHHFWKQWEGMVKDQHFPQLPHSDVLKQDKSDYEKGSDVRQRYIMQIDTAAVDLKNEVWDEGYYVYAYSTKEQGDFLLQVHPKYRKCFDDLKKKFDYLQAVVFTHGEIVGRKVVRLEKLRQCLGQLKETGSKLPGATGFGDK